MAISLQLEDQQFTMRTMHNDRQLNPARRRFGTQRSGLRWLVGTVVVSLALIGISASIAHYLVPPYNPGFLRYPIITALHIGLGVVYLTLAPLQFIGSIRLRFPAYHRWAGRLLVAVGLCIGLTALFMGIVIPFSGWGERVLMVLFGGWYLIALGTGFVHIRARRPARHREWMLRALAIGLSIATQRVIFVPILLSLADPTYGQIAAVSLTAWALAFISHTTLAEVWIRRTRRSSAATAA